MDEETRSSNEGDDHEGIGANRHERPLEFRVKQLGFCAAPGLAESVVIASGLVYPALIWDVVPARPWTEATLLVQCRGNRVGQLHRELFHCQCHAGRPDGT